MKQITVIFLLLIVIINVSSCSSKKVDKYNSIKIDLSCQDNALLVSSFIDTVKTIKLCLPDPYFFGIVTDILFTDSSLFVVDKKQCNILHLKMDGTFLNKIGNKGKAPGEFISLHRCFIGDKYIYVSDINTRRIHYYTHTGEYLKSIQSSFDLVYDDIVALPNGKFLCHDIQGNEGESKIWLMSEDGKKEQTFLYHKAVYPYSYTEWNTITTTPFDDILRIFDPITGCFYEYNYRTEKLKECECFVSNRKGLESFKSIETFENIDAEYAFPSFVIETNSFFYSIWTTSELIGLHVLYEKKEKNVRVSRRLSMDFVNYPMCPLPVSTNLSNVMVGIMTDEYPLEYFPEKYRYCVSEQTAIVYLMEFR